MGLPDPGPSRRTGTALALLGLLLAAGILRVVLVSRGGQYFWPDEIRYASAIGFWDAWEAGDRTRAVNWILNSGAHLGFKVLAIVPAWLQRHIPGGDLVPSLFFSLFSLANIGWVWRIARRAGADEREAFWAAAAMAASNSMFYWSRHLVPYDVGLFWALASAYAALKPTPRARDSFWAGLLGFLAFVTYAGTWSLVACILAAHALMAWPDLRRGAVRAVSALAGLAGPALLVWGAARALGTDLGQAYRGFAGSIVQGDFREGYVVFLDYLWSAERGSAVIWALCLGAAVVLARGSPAPARRRALLWAGIVVAMATILIAGSNLLGKFVVYGRLARQVAPFCALLVGWTAGRLFQERPWGRAERAALAALFLCGAWSMATPLRQEFPPGFRREAARVNADTRYRLGVASGQPVSRDRFRVLFCEFIWPFPAKEALPPGHQVLLASPHPLAWRPYLYEGFKREQRDLYEAAHLEMQLVFLPG